MLAFHSYGTMHVKENLILTLLSLILKNKLMENIREKHGLTYGFNVMQDDLSDHGLFIISSYTSSQFVLPMFYMVIQIIQSLKKDVDNASISSSKLLIKNSTYMTKNLGIFYCEQTLYSKKKIYNITDYLTMLNKISKYDILNTAKKMFTYDNTVFSGIGSLNNKQQNTVVKLIKLLK